MDIYTMKYYLSTKNEFLPSTTTWMDLEIIMLTEKSQTQKDKCSHVITNVRNLISKNRSIYWYITRQKQIHR